MYGQSNGQQVHMEGDGQLSEFRRLPGGWFYQQQPSAPLSVITSSRSKVQCVVMESLGRGRS